MSKKILRKQKTCRYFLLTLIALFWGASYGYGQDSGDVLGEVIDNYSGGAMSTSDGLIGGFSVAGIIGGLIFGSIGFVAFWVGKKNLSFKPMMFGILLMGYPYFVRDTLWLYVVGVGLTAALYFFRE